MKRIIFFLTFIPSIAYNQVVNIDTVQFNYTGIEISPDSSISSKILYSRAKEFVMENFKSGKDVIQMEDQENGILIGKGVIIPVIQVGFVGKEEFGYVNFEIKIQVKQGKYRYSIYNFRYTLPNDLTEEGPLSTKKPSCGTFRLPISRWRAIKEYADTEVYNLIVDLKKRMISSNDTF